jgi:hypothetical protein
MVLNMENETDLLQSLRRIIESYVADAEKKEELLSEVVRPKVKYVLAELEKYRSHEITEADRETIKDLFFHFC